MEMIYNDTRSYNLLTNLGSSAGMACPQYVYWLTYSAWLKSQRSGQALDTIAIPEAP